MTRFVGSFGLRSIRNPPPRHAEAQATSKVCQGTMNRSTAAQLCECTRTSGTTLTRLFVRNCRWNFSHIASLGRMLVDRWAHAHVCKAQALSPDAPGKAKLPGQRKTRRKRKAGLVVSSSCDHRRVSGKWGRPERRRLHCRRSVPRTPPHLSPHRGTGGSSRQARDARHRTASPDSEAPAQPNLACRAKRMHDYNGFVDEDIICNTGCLSACAKRAECWHGADADGPSILNSASPRTVRCPMI